MASLWMTVCLQPPVVNVQAAISDALKPFKIGRDDISLDRWKWDRWRISCGHGDAGFRIAAGFEYHPGLVWGTNACEPGWCAGGPRFALDLDGRREEAALQAGAAWDTWHELSRLLPPARPLVDFLPGKGTQRAVDAHRIQPLLQAFFGSGVAPKIIEAYAMPRLVVEGADLDKGVTGSLDPVVDFAVDREEYVAWQRDRAKWWGGLLTLDGWWREPGEPPVHGSCASLADCTHRLEISDVDDHLNALAHDVVIVALICHV